MKNNYIKALLVIGLMISNELIIGQTLIVPRQSPAATLTQKIGLTTLTITYSRPSVIRGNTNRSGQIWGMQVPYGLSPNAFGNQKDMPWRAGADENTTFSSSTDVLVEGEMLPAGTYGIHMIPYKDGKVTVIFSTNSSSWGSFWYEESEDALRVDVQSSECPFTNVLTYDFTELTPVGGTLSLSWDNRQIPVRIQVEQETILQSFRDQLRGQAGFTWQAPLAAANYCNNNNINLDEAIQWADRAIAGNKNGNTLGLKAALVYKKGDKAEALRISEQAAELATENELNTLGYTLMGLGETDKAIEYFRLNVKRNPKVANMYDSLGEGLMARGDNEEAIKMFRKSLSMNPPAFVKANSIANLKKLGVEYSE